MGTIEGRLACYALAVIAVTGLWLALELAKSYRDLGSDPSAMAWVGFLPFIVPIFLAYSSIIVAGVAAVIEIVIAVVRWWGTK